MKIFLFTFYNTDQNALPTNRLQALINNCYYYALKTCVSHYLDFVISLLVLSSRHAILLSTKMFSSTLITLLAFFVVSITAKTYFVSISPPARLLGKNSRNEFAVNYVLATRSAKFTPATVFADRYSARPVFAASGPSTDCCSGTPTVCSDQRPSSCSPFDPSTDCRSSGTPTVCPDQRPSTRPPTSPSTSCRSRIPLKFRKRPVTRPPTCNNLPTPQTTCRQPTECTSSTTECRRPSTRPPPTTVCTDPKPKAPAICDGRPPITL